MKNLAAAIGVLFYLTGATQMIEWHNQWINSSAGYYHYGNNQYTKGAYTTLALNIFSGSTDLDPGPASLSIGEGALIETINDSGGISEWIHIPGSLSVNTLVRDDDQNIYMLGSHDAFVDLQAGAGEFNTSFAQGVFLVKLDPLYNVIWMREFPDMVIGGFDLLANNIQYSHHLSLDASNNIYITGTFNGTIDFDPGAGVVNLSNSGQNDAFLLKLNSSGNYQWVISYNGFSYSEGNYVTVDSSGNPIIIGAFNSPIDVDPGPGVTILNANGSELFVCKYSPAGSLIWAKEIGTPSAPCSGHKIVCDLSDNIVIQGTYLGQVDVDPGAGTYTLNSGNSANLFISTLDTNGEFEWAQGLHSTGSNLITGGLAVSAFGKVYFSFYSEGDTYLDSRNCSNLVRTDNSVGIIASYDASGNFLNHIAIEGDIDSQAGFLNAGLDSSENLYVSGMFIGTVDLNPGPCYDPIDYGFETGGFSLTKINYSGENCQLLHSGCTDFTACNYNAYAQCDNGKCIYIIAGCSNPEACNYEPEVYCSDDSTCVFPGCTYPGACNYNSDAGCDDGTCDFHSCACTGDFNNDGFVGISDLLQFVGVYGTVCD
jgi:hypothetical protein